MPAPLLPAIPALLKAGLGALKLGKIGGAIGKGAGAVKSFAGPRLSQAIGEKSLSNLAITFGPDVLGGTMVGAMTPGDLGDKIIAGTMDAGLGAIGGVGLTGLTGNFGKTRILTDMVGGYGGAFAGQAAGDQLMRVKDKLGGGEGQTPYERMASEDRRMLEQQILASMGRGGYGIGDFDPFMMTNGLGG